MSLIRPALNTYLRLIEKRKMRRAKTPQKLRQNLELSARLLFHPPRGTQVEKTMFPGDVDVLTVTPKYVTSDFVIFYIHGGGFVFGSPETHAAMLGQLAARVGARVVMPRYRLAPEFKFPAAADDVEAAYGALIASGVAAQNIVVGGDSAGGALAYGLLSGILTKKLPAPRGVFGFSPFVDFTRQGASFVENAEREAVLAPERAVDMLEMYLADADRSDARLNTLSADFGGAPPVWLCVGDTEILRDDSRALSQHLKSCDVDVNFHEEHDLPHVWPIFHNILPEARQTLDDLAGWITALPTPVSES
ncbi:alpha/beta hydrolase [uncultured Sulfitobacter sp.]|uniref:alpha/beta hydrolase n=1 Tax=uncultured Sulfitobacter sp. TaxID=191468 RepID=UPI0030D6FD80|tara:strand:+ start:152612 stop:153529 length:918 start_codon:yes stop_codon:yes gene_type:complete